MQRVNLTYDYAIEKFSKRERRKLPCPLIEGGCETATLNLFAYTWDKTENFVITKILTQDAKKLHYPLTTDQRKVNSSSRVNSMTLQREITY